MTPPPAAHAAGPTPPIPADHPATVAALLARRLHEDADRVVYRCEGRTLNYGGLDRHAAQVAAGLRAEGLGAQDRMGYLALNSDWYFELLFGCARAGCVMVGVNWRLAPPEVAYVVNDAGIKLLVVGRDFLPVWQAVADQCPTVTTVLVLEDDYVGWRDGQSADPEPSPVNPGDVLVQMYTSGTTGFPKGALLTHGSILGAMARGRLVGEDWTHWDKSDVSLIATPVFHIGGTAWGLQAIYHGGSSVVLAKPDVGDMLRAIEQFGVTKMFAVPALLNAILNHPDAATTTVSSMREIIYGASPIPLDVLRRALALFGCQFIQQYGMTETSGSVTYLPPEDHDVAGTPRMASCGKPYPWTEIRIVDPDGRPVGAGAVGEILIRTNSIMKGYWNKPEATARAIVDGWYHSGDAGYLDADGYLYMFDRVKDMIVSGAENIYPAEIENALHEHPDVKDCAVIGVPDERWGEAVKAIVVKRDGSALDADGLIRFARTRIAGYKVPKSVDFVADLPRNPSGKILKKDLRAPYWEGRTRQVN
jgi:long-chain acyl-CoA synthetase